jgi:hypothetical protein
MTRLISATLTLCIMVISIPPGFGKDDQRLKKDFTQVVGDRFEVPTLFAS